jgi:hypothetical protein
MKKTVKSSMKKYATGGTTQKKAPQDFISKANRYIDDLFRSSVNKSVAATNKKIQKKLDPVRKDVASANKKIQKKLDPVRKKAAEVNTQTQKMLDSVRGAIYNKPSTKTTKSKTTKSTTTKPAATKSSLTKSTVTKPAVTKTTVSKPVTTVTTSKTTTPAKTVSQLWTEKTGTSWAEAKKQGLTDGSAASNMALMKKLQSGNVGKNTASTVVDNDRMPIRSVAGITVTKSNSNPATAPVEKPEAKPTVKQMAGSGMGAMERMEGMYKKGGSVKRKMKSKKK